MTRARAKSMALQLVGVYVLVLLGHIAGLSPWWNVGAVCLMILGWPRAAS